ncbi:glycosyltransferase family 2 protein [Synechococcus sp. PCC 7336]|uniref:glycosyltransferase family 2 protein n=1 Tax=Synechococcus sp. PCC 7336 TaxID=195250 RepID=UPI00138AE277|nr:glycosyltransferase [Synechococcus sp. PCC 7336]
MTIENEPQVSLIVVSYNMARELPRVLLSLTPPYQQGIEARDIEIIVVDNGSIVPPDPSSFPQGVRLRVVENPTVSPARAINVGLKDACGDLIGVLIDGARMASPGLCKYALLAARLHHRPIISTLGFHLGPDIQRRSLDQGYCQREEDRLLDSIRWQDNGYGLFEISVFAGSSKHGWFMPIAESNALFLTRALWNELDGFEERFELPGGGLVNLDTYVRACKLPNTELITLLGEGTFHQVHGGITTNQNKQDISWKVFHQNYIDIRGKNFAVPSKPCLFLGTIPPAVRKSIKLAADLLVNHV